MEGVLTGRTEAGQAFPISWHWPASGPLSGGGVPSTGRACQDCQVGICIMQGRLVGKQNEDTVFSEKIQNYLLVPLAILMGCGLAFAELGSRQRALRCRLDCATYSRHMGGSSSPQVKPLLSSGELSAISTTPRAFQEESILTW